MVHRAADSRLLNNLLQHEKEYTRQLRALLDSSNASLASFAAYAAASSQPTSQVVMAVAGSLAAADDALRRYSQSVELWRETMAHLKDMEDELGNVIRDREILVTRLLKATKSSKGGSASIRESLIPSSSSLSLREGSSSRPLSLTFSTSSKLGAAQTELQACELHLAAKESELEITRSAALREGLGTRLKALVDCGWAWGEFGREGLRTLELLGGENSSDQNHATVNSGTGSECDSLIIKPSSTSEYSSAAPAITSTSVLTGSTTTPPAVSKCNNLSGIHRTSIATTILTESGSRTSTPSHAHAALLSATPSTLTYASAVAVHIPPSSSTCPSPTPQNEIAQNSEVHLDIPAPHALGAGYIPIPIAIPIPSSPPELKSGLRDVEDVKEEEDMDANLRGKSVLRSKSRSSSKRLKEGEMASQHVEVESIGKDESKEDVDLGCEEIFREVDREGNVRNQVEGEHDDKFEGEEEGKGCIKRRDMGNERERDREEEREEREIEDGNSEERAPDSDVDDHEPPFVVVENPKYMSEEREKEVERGGEDARGRGQKMVQGVVKEKEGEKVKKAEEEEEEEEVVSQSIHQQTTTTVDREYDRLPPSMTSSATPAPLSPPTSTSTQYQNHGPFSKYAASISASHGHVHPRCVATVTPNPNLNNPKPDSNPSPSKRFLGSLRGLFGVSPGSNHDKEKSVFKSRSGGDPDAQRGADDAEAEASDSSGSLSDERKEKDGERRDKNWKKMKNRKAKMRKAKPKEGHGGLHGLLFRFPDKEKERAWETRTMKNLKELSRENVGVAAVEAGPVAGSSKRRDIQIPISSSSRSGSVDRLVGWIGSAGAGAGSEKKKEKGKQSERSASDVGVSWDLGLVPKRSSRLKKNRAMDLDSTPGLGRAGSVAIAATNWIHRPSPPHPQTPPRRPSNPISGHVSNSESKHKNKLKPQRSASVDIGVGIAKRRSGSEWDQDWEQGQDGRVEGGGTSKVTVSPVGKTMIVDLGRKGGGDEGDGDEDLDWDMRRGMSERSGGGDVIRHMELQTKSPYASEPVGVGVSSSPHLRNTVPKSDVVANDKYAVGSVVPAGVPFGRKKSLTRVKAKERRDAVDSSLGNDVVPGPSLAKSQKPVDISGAVKTRPMPPARRASTEAVMTSTRNVEIERVPRYQRKLSFGGSGHAVGDNNVGSSAGSGDLSRKSTLLNSESMPLLVGSSRGGRTGDDGDGEFRGGTGSSSAGKARRSDTLGQGVKDSIGAGSGSGVGRRSSVVSNVTTRSHTGVTTDIGKSSSTPSKSGSGISHSTMVVQPMPVATNLMNIVEDVARVNREGWNADWNVTTTRGKGSSSDSKTGSMKFMEVVKAPPSIGREALEVMDLKEMKRLIEKPATRSAGVGGAGASSTKTTDVPGLFQVQAPGSVFDERYRLRGASASVIELTRPATSSGVHDRLRSSTSSAKGQMEQQSFQGSVGPVQDEKGKRPMSGRRSANVSSTTRDGSPTALYKGVALVPVPGRSSQVQELQKPSTPLQVRTPLKGVLKNSSRTPSPVPVPVPSLRTMQNCEAGRHVPLAASSLRPPPTEVTESRLEKRSDLPIDGDRDLANDNSSSSETGEEIFYSGEEEVEWLVPPPPPMDKNRIVPIPAPVQKSQILPIENPPVENGHAAGYTAEQSDLTASILMTTRPGRPVTFTHQQQQETVVQAPRKRKSVRVSLQPTFSPPAPAIEYDDEEETRNQSKHQRSHRPENWERNPVKKQQNELRTMTVVKKTGADIWEDSSEEDEEYKMAKVALTKAAKRDKEVSLLVANRRALA